MGVPGLQTSLPLDLKELLSWFNFLLYLIGLGDCCCSKKVGKGDLDTEGGENYLGRDLLKHQCWQKPASFLSTFISGTHCGATLEPLVGEG